MDNNNILEKLWGIGRSGLYPAGVAAEAAKIIEDQALDLIRATNEIISLERQLRSSHAPKDSSTDYGEGFEEGYKAGRVNMEAYPRI